MRVKYDFGQFNSGQVRKLSAARPRRIIKLLAVAAHVLGAGFGDVPHDSRPSFKVSWAQMKFEVALIELLANGHRTETCRFIRGSGASSVNLSVFAWCAR